MPLLSIILMWQRKTTRRELRRSLTNETRGDWMGMPATQHTDVHFTNQHRPKSTEDFVWIWGIVWYTKLAFSETRKYRIMKTSGSLDTAQNLWNVIGTSVYPVNRYSAWIQFEKFKRLNRIHTHIYIYNIHRIIYILDKLWPHCDVIGTMGRTMGESSPNGRTIQLFSGWISIIQPDFYHWGISKC